MSSTLPSFEGTVVGKNDEVPDLEEYSSTGNQTVNSQTHEEITSQKNKIKLFQSVINGKRK